MDREARVPNQVSVNDPEWHDPPPSRNLTLQKAGQEVNKPLLGSKRITHFERAVMYGTDLTADVPCHSSLVLTPHPGEPGLLLVDTLSRSVRPRSGEKHPKGRYRNGETCPVKLVESKCHPDHFARGIQQWTP